MSKVVIQDHGELLKAIQVFSDGSASEARGYLKQYFQTQGEYTTLLHLDNISDTYIPREYGWAAKLLLDGFTIGCYDDENVLHERIKRAVWNAPAVEIEVVKKPVKKVYGGDIENAIDEFIEGGCKLKDFEFDSYAYLEKEKVPPGEVRRLLSHFTTFKTEIEEIEGDSELKDAYTFLGKRQRGNLIKFLSGILDSCDNYISNNRTRNKINRPVKKRKLAKVKYMESSDELQLVSQDPTKINGAKEVWIVHEKYNLLIVYRAETINDDGLQLSGSSIKNFKEVTSGNKKMLRKNIPALGKLGKRAMNKHWKDLKRKMYPNNGRLNKNHIIIGVF